MAKAKRIGPVARLLRTTEQWTKGAIARVSKRGRAVWSDSPEARCFCIGGALCRAYPEGERRERARERLIAAIGLNQFEMTLAEWNDKPGRRFSHVRAAVLEAGI